MPPPAGKPITIRIGRDGKVCARAPRTMKGAATAPSMNLRRVGEAEAMVIPPASQAPIPMRLISSRPGLFVGQAQGGRTARGETMTATTKTGPAKPESAMKVGLMVPANNTTMERELAAWLPEGSTVTTVKIPRGEGCSPGTRSPPIATGRSRWRVSISRDGEVELLAYGCTAAGFLSGPVGRCRARAAAPRSDLATRGHHRPRHGQRLAA